jgi:hypothetical protein
MRGLDQRQIFCTHLAAHLISLDLERDLLTFRQPGQACPFNGADVHEHVIAAIVWLDKAKALLAIEPLDGTCRHFLLQSTCRATITRLPFNWSMSLGKSPQAHFRKAQRLIECRQAIGSDRHLQARWANSRWNKSSGVGGQTPSFECPESPTSRSQDRVR